MGGVNRCWHPLFVVPTSSYISTSLFVSYHLVASRIDAQQDEEQDGKSPKRRTTVTEEG